MPYEVKRSGKGYKVFHKGTDKSYSNKTMSRSQASRQMRAMYANTKKEDLKG